MNNLQKSIIKLSKHIQSKYFLSSTYGFITIKVIYIHGPNHMKSHSFLIANKFMLVVFLGIKIQIFF